MNDKKPEPDNETLSSNESAVVSTDEQHAFFGENLGNMKRVEGQEEAYAGHRRPI